MFLNSFNHFRALAIVLIVAGHSYSIVNLQFDTLFEKVLGNIITGGTFLFVFISGFLFHYVFYKKYEFYYFTKKKLQNVVVPYIVISTIPIYRLIVGENEDNVNFDSTNIIDYIPDYLMHLLSGDTFIAYWYIPFIIIIFLLSPLHSVFIKLELRFQLILVLIFCILSLFIHRPYENNNAFHNVIYFTPIYLIGILSSIYKEIVLSSLKNKELYLLFGIIIFSLIQSLWGIQGNYVKNFFEYNGLDLMFIQKLTMCFLFFIFLERFENYNNKYLHILASTSFTIFFLHPFLLKYYYFLGENIFNNGSWLMFIIIVTFNILFCIILAVTIRKVFGKFSRYITGY